ncbi:MAG: Trk family potassium uptake protein, partial [Chloroflexota bacterium]|nr:Trk family potassium uptake protein [Chloroflexota bacterium]
MHPSTLLVAGFALLIAVGSGLLLLPFSARETDTDLLTAFFTATSAVCVTGLVVVDTGTHWSPFGQAVIMALMQLGGLGFVVGVTALMLFRHGRVSLRHRLIMQQTGTATGLSGQAGLIRRAVFLALVAEGTGMLLL